MLGRVSGARERREASSDAQPGPGMNFSVSATFRNVVAVESTPLARRSWARKEVSQVRGNE